MKITECTREELEEFVRTYPRPLTFDVYRAGEPPWATYNDFTLGKWPESVVAGYFTMGGNPDDIWDEVPSNFTIAKDAK